MTAAAAGAPHLVDLEGAEADSILRSWLAAALQARTSGGASTTYNHLVASVNHLKCHCGKPEDEWDLINLLHQLVQCVTLVDERRHLNLLNLIFDVPLWRCSQELRSALLDFISHLVVANGNAVRLCLHMLVYSILPPPLHPADTTTAVLGQPWQPDTQAQHVQDEIVAATLKIMMLVPTSLSHLLHLLAAVRPHKMARREYQCMYLRAVFALSESPAGASIREGLLALVVEQLVDVDVEIKWEDIADAATGEGFQDEQSSDEDDDNTEDVFAMAELEQMTREAHAQLTQTGPDAAVNDPVKGRGGWEGAAGSAAAPKQQSNKPPLDETADKLDSMMELTLGYLQRCCQSGQLAPLWRIMLSTWERSVLPVHRCKFTQFLLFYLCQQAPEQCSQTFVQLLLDRLADVRQAPMVRSACAAYLASFLARARAVPERLVVSTLEELAGWALRYCQDQDRRRAAALAAHLPLFQHTMMGDTIADGLQHQVFYAVCQALLYILCYHLEPLLAPAQRPAQGDAAHPQPAPAQRRVQAVRALFQHTMPQLLQHRLAPLAVCVPSVVREFAEQVAALRLMDCSQLTNPGTGRGERQQRPLEMFFPFDPYLLKRSERFLDTKATYVRWQGGHPRSQARAGLEDEEGNSSAASSDDDEDLAIDEDNDDRRSSVLESSDESDDEPGSSFGTPNFPMASQPRVTSAGLPRPVPIGASGGQRPGSLGSDPASDEVLESYSPEGPTSMGASPYGMSPLGGKSYLAALGHMPAPTVTGFHLPTTHVR